MNGIDRFWVRAGAHVHIMYLLARETNLNYEPSKPNSYYYTDWIEIEIERIYLQQMVHKVFTLIWEKNVCSVYYKEPNMILFSSFSLCFYFCRLHILVWATIAPHTFILETKLHIFVYSASHRIAMYNCDLKHIWLQIQTLSHTHTHIHPRKYNESVNRFRLNHIHACRRINSHAHTQTNAHTYAELVFRVHSQATVLKQQETLWQHDCEHGQQLPIHRRQTIGCDSIHSSSCYTQEYKMRNIGFTRYCAGDAANDYFKMSHTDKWNEQINIIWWGNTVGNRLARANITLEATLDIVDW